MDTIGTTKLHLFNQVGTGCTFGSHFISTKHLTQWIEGSRWR